MSEKVDNKFVMYPPERITEVIDLFSVLLKEADNSGTLQLRRTDLTDEEYTAASKDARKYWAGLRREGANILGVVKHLRDQLAHAEKVIEQYHAAELAKDYLDETDHQ